jgi:hypothetical protein
MRQTARRTWIGSSRLGRQRRRKRKWRSQNRTRNRRGIWKTEDFHRGGSFILGLQLQPCFSL